MAASDTLLSQKSVAPESLPRRQEFDIQEQLAMLQAAFAPGGRLRYRYLLVLRFSLLNLAAGALLAGAWLQGWLGPVFATDATGLTLVIVGVFLIGLALTGQRVWQLSCELNEVDSRSPQPESRTARYLAAVRRRSGNSRSILASSLKAKLSARLAVIRHIATSLILLGLIGTVIGFIIALSGVEPEAAGNVEAVAPMVSNLILGMSVALYTTLVGAVLNVWLMANYRLLSGGTVALLTAIVERGECQDG